jgi:hypothetical protein
MIIQYILRRLNSYELGRNFSFFQTIEKYKPSRALIIIINEQKKKRIPLILLHYPSKTPPPRRHAPPTQQKKKREKFEKNQFLDKTHETLMRTIRREKEACYVNEIIEGDIK